MDRVKAVFMRYIEVAWGDRVSFRLKEHRKIWELMVDLKAKFKNMMEDRLISVVANSFSRANGDNYKLLNRITDVTWDAVSYMEPDAFIGKPVDPKLYVKVKCIVNDSPDRWLSYWEATKETGLKIILNGYYHDELKKIKSIVEVAVGTAYLLIRENLVIWGSMIHKSTENTIFSKCNEALMEHKDDIIAVLGSGGISVFISTRNAKTGTACLPDIKLYRNFDMHIGMFLVDYLFNQKLLCGTCNEVPEAHISYFTHYDKRIAVEVRSLPSDKHLPGEAEGKVWCWDYCGESNVHSKRRLFCDASYTPSLQMIIKELFKDDYQDTLLWDKLPNCVFLGLGSMVAMSRFSRVPTYSVSLPRRKFKFNDLMEGDFLLKEVENVVKEGRSLFAEVENSLKEMEEQSLEGSCEIFHDIKKMLKQEQDQFEVDISDVSVNNRALYLNHIQWKLSLLSHIWDQRFCCLGSSDLNTQLTVKKQSCFQEICGGDDGVLSLKSADPQGWMWRPFSELVSIFSKDLHKGSLPRYEASTHNTESIIYKRISEEESRLHFPLGSTDNNHIVSDYEDEFSSIIACALASPEDRKKSPDVISYQTSQKISSLSSLNWCCFSFFKGPDGSSICDPSEESFYSIFDEVEWENRSSYLHPLISMGRSPNKPKYSVACLFHKEFLKYRIHCGLSELDFISSLSRCKPWDAKGGKSKSFFAKTLDDRFIIKQISKTEFSSFHETAVAYFAYMNNTSETCLAKILGVYQVTSEKSGEKYDLMVMENIAYCRKFATIYDLKGALYNRLSPTPATDGAGDVLLDQNFVNDMKVSPLHVNWKAERRLQQAIWNDTAFLHFINVMDYSLLVGVDDEREELVCGIIDSLRQYTFDKKMETVFKSWLIVPKNHLPTIIPPEDYKKRFRKFIGNHVNDPISLSLQEYKKVHPKAQICSPPTIL